MSFTSPNPKVFVHADHIREVDAHKTHVQVEEPAADDAAAIPSLFEALEEALWRGAEAEAEEATPRVGREALLGPGLDVDEVLHPVAGIELDT